MSLNLAAAGGAQLALARWLGLICQGAGGVKFWRYGSGLPFANVGVSPGAAQQQLSDTLAQILAAGYFNPLGFMLTVGDLIFVRDVNGLEAVLQVTGNTNFGAENTFPYPFSPQQASPTGTVTVSPYTGAALAGALSGAALSGVEGILYGITAAVPTAAGTAEQTLGTFNLPANALDKVGRRLRVTAAFQNAANVNNKTAKLYFGGSSISTPTAASNGKHTFLELNVNKTGPSTQIVYGFGCVDTTPVTPFVNAASAENDTAAIVIKATGTDGTSSAGDITLVDFLVEYMN